MVLGLQAEGAVLRVAAAGFAVVHIVFMDIVAGIELYAGLGGPAVQTDGAGRVFRGGKPFFFAFLRFQYEGMIVAFGQTDLFIGKIQTVADSAAFPEVHGSSVHGEEPAGGKIAGASFREAVGLHGQYCIGAGRSVLAAQIEIGMIGQINDRRLVGLRLIDHTESVVLVQCIGDFKLQGAGIALFAVRTGILHDQGAVLDMGPEDSADIGSVQVIGAVIGFQPVCNTVQRETGILDPVGVTAYERAVVAAAVFVILQCVITQGNVRISAVAHRNQDLLDGGAVGQDIDLHAGLVGHGISVDGNAGFCGTERFFKYHSHL